MGGPTLGPSLNLGPKKIENDASGDPKQIFLEIIERKLLAAGVALQMDSRSLGEIINIFSVKPQPIRTRPCYDPDHVNLCLRRTNIVTRRRLFGRPQMRGNSKCHQVPIFPDQNKGPTLQLPIFPDQNGGPT